MGHFLDFTLCGRLAARDAASQLAYEGRCWHERCARAEERASLPTAKFSERPASVEKKRRQGRAVGASVRAKAQACMRAQRALRTLRIVDVLMEGPK